VIENQTKNNFDEEAFLANKLRDILLKNDRASIHKLEEILDNQDELAERISPIVDYKINLLKQKFPKEFQLAVNQIVEKKMKESQEEILDLIYPVLGKMIKKYIVHQFDEIKEKLDTQVRSLFTIKGLKLKIKSMIYGIDNTELLLSNIDKPKIEEIHIIERDSGILYGSATLRPTIDRDVIAGMLTAIKSFVEDAFQREEEELEMIEYGSYKIFIQNFRRFYFSIAMSGSLSVAQRKELSTSILRFAEKEINQILANDSGDKYDIISEKLKAHFYDTESKIFN